MRARRMRQRRAREWARDGVDARRPARPIASRTLGVARLGGARARLHLSRNSTASNRLHDKDPEAHPDASPRPSRPSPDPTGTAMTDVTAATTPLVGAFNKIKESAMHVVGQVRAGEAVPA